MHPEAASGHLKVVTGQYKSTEKLRTAVNKSHDKVNYGFHEILFH